MRRTVVISACTGYITTNEDVADTTRVGDRSPPPFRLFTSLSLPLSLSLFLRFTRHRSKERASEHALRVTSETEIDFAIET